NETPLLVDDREPAVADRVDVPEEAPGQLLRHTHGAPRRLGVAGGDAGGPHPVLEAQAPAPDGNDAAVVALDGLEVAVGHEDQLPARAAAGGLDSVQEHLPWRAHGGQVEQRAALADDQGLHLADRLAVDLQAEREDGRAPELADSAPA